MLGHSGSHELAHIFVHMHALLGSCYWNPSHPCPTIAHLYRQYSGAQLDLHSRRYPGPVHIAGLQKKELSRNWILCQMACELPMFCRSHNIWKATEQGLCTAPALHVTSSRDQAQCAQFGHAVLWLEAALWKVQLNICWDRLWYQ